MEQRPYLTFASVRTSEATKRGKKKVYFRKLFCIVSKYSIIPVRSHEWVDSKGDVFFSPGEKDVINGAKECRFRAQKSPWPRRRGGVWDLCHKVVRRLHLQI